MKTTALAIALLLSGTAVAQTTTYTTTTTQPELDVDVQPDGDLDVDVDQEVVTTTHTTTTHNTMAHSTTFAASGAVIQPSNANPERDARGIAVISDPAVVPAGWNGTVSTGMGGPLVDPLTGQTIDADDESYPACTASVTDNCIQTYEVGRD
ncbi:MAG TPA: hypothetical protein VFO69_01850 [Allosphingosinicella sp.]|nr:hypothetical protein [Allosphingosinicella sp.]